MIDVSKLRMPTVSRACMEVMHLLESEDVDVRSVANVVSMDPMLSGTLLRYANSPLYRRACEATSVQQAINLLGLRQVKAAAVVATMRGFCGHDPLSALLWEQGMAVSTLARAIATPRFRALADEMELIGLMHNVGALVLLANFPDLYAAMVEGIRQDGTLVHVAEREVFGLHRGDLAVHLAGSFHLPQRVVAVLAGYHARQVPAEVDTDPARALACLWLAQGIGRRSQTANDWLPEWLPPDLSALMQLLVVDEDEFLNLTEDCEALVAERMAA